VVTYKQNVEKKSVFQKNMSKYGLFSSIFRNVVAEISHCMELYLVVPGVKKMAPVEKKSWMECEYRADFACWAKNLIKIPVLTLHSAHFLLPELSFYYWSFQIRLCTVWNSGYNTAKDSTQQIKHFKNFELDIEIFKINKPPAGLQKVLSYAVESS
jgi:hypothetical protein